MTNEIFISHSSQDAECARKVLQYIEDNGYDCYISSRDIRGGLHYAKDIVNVLKECKVVVLIASAHSNLSEHVLNEIDICVDNKKTIIPLFIEDFDISDEFRYYLGRSQRVIVEGDDVSEAFPRLMDAIRNKYTLKEKLQKWCEFDSCVGWGKFNIDIDIDEDNGTLSGTLSINECFMVDKKHKHPICSFIVGYCTGVIEALLGDMEIVLSCKTCPLKNKFKSECVFDIALDMEA